MGAGERRPAGPVSRTGGRSLAPADGYFPGLLAGAGVAAVLLLVFLWVFFVALVLLDTGLLALAVLLEGAAALGAWAANVRGMVATANAMAANKVFFIFFSLLGSLPAYNSMVRQMAEKLDSLRRLWNGPKSHLPGLTFIRHSTP